MKMKGGRREDRIQDRIERLVKKVLKLEQENRELKAKIEEVHEMYTPVIGKMHRMYCIPSQSDKIMTEILDDLGQIEAGRQCLD